MKAVLVFISTLILVANAQDNEKVAEFAKKLMQEFCGNENFMKSATECYNSVPQRMVDPIFECAGESYVTGEEIVTAVCSEETEIEENVDQEAEKECVQKKYEEAGLALEDNEWEEIKTSCKSLQDYAEDSGLMVILKDIIENANGAK